MALVSDPEKGADQHETSKGHLQPHFRGGPLGTHHEIEGVIEPLAHLRRELRLLGLALKLVEANAAAAAVVDMS